MVTVGAISTECKFHLYITCHRSDGSKCIPVSYKSAFYCLVYCLLAF